MSGDLSFLTLKLLSHTGDLDLFLIMFLENKMAKSSRMLIVGRKSQFKPTLGAHGEKGLIIVRWYHYYWREYAILVKLTVTHLCNIIETYTLAHLNPEILYYRMSCCDQQRSNCFKCL